MIVNSLKKSLFQLVFSPWVLLPFIAVTIFTFLLTNFVSDIIQKPLVDMILYYEAIAESNLLFIFVTQYPLEILTIILVGFVGLVVSSMALLTLARIAKGEGFVNSVNESVMDFGKAASLGVFFMAALVVLVAVLFLFSIVIDLIVQLIPSTAIILGALIFPAIILIVGGILLVRFSFIIPALIDQKLKKALQKSWSFSSNKFWNALILIIILLLISFIIGLIADNIAIIFGGEFDTIILTAGNIISTTFFGLTIANYYYSE